MNPEVVTHLAAAATSVAALVGGMFADTWGFAVLLAVIAFLWFKVVSCAATAGKSKPNWVSDARG